MTGGDISVCLLINCLILILIFGTLIFEKCDFLKNYKL